MTTTVYYARPKPLASNLRWHDLEPGTYFVFGPGGYAGEAGNLFLRIPEGYVKLTSGGGNPYPAGRLNVRGDFELNDTAKSVRVVTRLDITPHFDV